jgi:hypothetical protein
MLNVLKVLGLFGAMFAGLVVVALLIARWPVIGFLLAAAGFGLLVHDLADELNRGNTIREVLSRRISR